MADRDRPWSKFYWSDWESDNALRQCSLAAQGLWMRMLCICARADTRGYLAIAGVPLDVDALATAVSRPETELAPLMAELEHWGVFSRDRKGRIYSRRMLRDDRRSKTGRKIKKQALARASQLSEEQREIPPPSRGPPSPPSPQRPEARITNKRVPPLSSPPPSAGADAGCRPVDGADDGFAAFWQRYPQKIAKRRAEQAYRVALKRGHAATTILAGLDGYLTAKPPEWPWCNPATFLNGDRFLDETTTLEAAHAPPRSPNAGDSPDSPGRRPGFAPNGVSAFVRGRYGNGAEDRDLAGGPATAAGGAAGGSDPAADGGPAIDLSGGR